MNIFGSHLMKRTLLCAAFSAGAGPALAQMGAAGGGDLAKFPKELKNLPALHLANPTHAAMLAATRAGARSVAVGDHGIVLLSDDGKIWRQAREVPTRAMLTSVCFVDGKRGWVVGHWGQILHTEDGGETWKLQRIDINVDQPLFSVYFSDARHGIAVGLWSLALRTADGGTSWTPLKMPTMSANEKAGPNLYQIFAARNNVLYVAAEQGLVFKSPDGGETWDLLNTGNHGSFWTGLSTRDDSVLVGGLNGKIWRSVDAGRTWSELNSGVTASITALAQSPDGGVTGVGLEGVVIDSRDGVNFTPRPRLDRASLTAVITTAGGAPLIFSKDGVVQSN